MWPDLTIKILNLSFIINTAFIKIRTFFTEFITEAVINSLKFCTCSEDFYEFRNM